MVSTAVTTSADAVLNRPVRRVQIDAMELLVRGEALVSHRVEAGVA